MGVPEINRVFCCLGSVSLTIQESTQCICSGFKEGLGVRDNDVIYMWCKPTRS